MKRALIDPRNGMIAQLADGDEFLVAAPLFWGEVPDDAVPGAAVLQMDGGTNLPAHVLVRQAILASDALTVITYVLQAGGVIAAHAHADRGHTTNVLRGTIRVLRNGATEHYEAGRQTSFAVGELHAIEAITESVIVNITDA